MKKAFFLPAVYALVVAAAASTKTVSTHVPEERSQELGPAWDPRPAWQRATDGAWFELFRRRPVNRTTPSVIVPVVDHIPFRVPRAMNAVPAEYAEPVGPVTETTPGTIEFPPCKNDAGSYGPRGSTAEEKQIIA